MLITDIKNFQEKNIYNNYLHSIENRAQMSHDKLDRIKKKLRSLEWIPKGEIDDTRFEKLYGDLRSYLQVHADGSPDEDLDLFLSADPLNSIKVCSLFINSNVAIDFQCRKV